MDSKTKSKLQELEWELNTLGGGMNGLGRLMYTLGADPGADLCTKDLETTGYLVVSMSKHVERLASDLDRALMESKSDGAGVAGSDTSVGHYLHLDAEA